MPEEAVIASLSRSLTVPAPLDRVAGYLSDLTTAPEWDPHTAACRRLDTGPIRVGAQYELTRTFGAYRVAMTVEVREVTDSLITWEGGNEFATGRETFAFAAADAGTTVLHTVDVHLRGVARFGTRLVPGVMRRIADDGTPVLRARLQRLAVP
ncbi:SRPBCC family protein [uncultured Jatrophihabitans sp.]|uniref:SRPBCC family protein n=1 Tax=uncultured Jatrophihabitans sp. TaxID=1610747 RepID=UPI0035CBC8D7